MDNATVLEMRGVCKAFDGVLALDHVDFHLNAGEIHGLLGGNGAGKTTLMNILYGLYRPDAGEIILHGQRTAIRSPRDAIRHNIGMVHQHFLQIESFSVTENVVPGAPIRNPLSLDLREAEDRIRALGERFGLAVDPQRCIRDLSIGARQRVEILKALYRGARILILDEPTTNLTPQEVDTLFHTVRAMVQEGLSVVFITHKLREVWSVCDRITVLREGRNVFTLRRDEATEEQFVRGMVGESLDIQKSVIFSGGASVGNRAIGSGIVLALEGVSVAGEGGALSLRDCSFQVREGEIFGIAGVAGNGQRSLAEAVMSLQPLMGGRATVLGKDIAQLGTAGLLRAGVTYIPEDRLADGFLPTSNVAQNLILGMHRSEPYARGQFLNWKAIFQASRQLISEYNIRTSGPSDVGGNLSGGNIQRVLVARAFAHPSVLVVAHNPTRGLDIASTEFVYGKLLEHKRKQGATLLISEDLDELLLLCDRIGVLCKGELMGILERSDFDRYLIGRMMTGVSLTA